MHSHLVVQSQTSDFQSTLVLLVLHNALQLFEGKNGALPNQLELVAALYAIKHVDDFIFLLELIVVNLGEGFFESFVVVGSEQIVEGTPLQFLPAVNELNLVLV